MNIPLETDALIEKWSPSGALFVGNGDSVLYNDCFGFADHAGTRCVTPDDSYTLFQDEALFVFPCILMLRDEGRLKLSDPLSLYIPEYPNAGKITIEQLMYNRSGIPDWFYGKVTPALEQDAKHSALGCAERFKEEARLLALGVDFPRLLELVGDELTFDPASGQSVFSISNRCFLAETVRRVSGLSLFECEKKYLFEPLGITGVSAGNHASTQSRGVLNDTDIIPMPFADTDAVLTLTASDFTALARAFSRGGLLSDKSRRLLMNPGRDSDGFPFHNSHGFTVIDCDGPLGYFAQLGFRSEDGGYFAFISCESLIARKEGVRWTCFTRELRKLLCGYFISYRRPRMVRVNPKIGYEVMEFQVTQSQEDFVMPALEALSACSFLPEWKPFAVMEGDTPVGLLVLGVDPKKDYYGIEIVLIDYRFQSKGYGSFMVRRAVDYLKRRGAKELIIGCNRRNNVARRLYESVGFRAADVYPEGVELKLSL